MDALAEEYAARGVSSVFIYTREAHPGEHYPAHDSFERKLAHARALRDLCGLRREILVDDLEGIVHRAYGLLPNMTWIVLRGGRIGFKADWTSVDDVRAALAGLLAPRPHHVPYYSEQLRYRPVDREAFVRGLERTGPKAVADFLASMRRQG